VSILWSEEGERFWAVVGKWDILVCGRKVCIIGRKVCIIWESEIFGAVGGKCVFCGVSKVRYFGLWEEGGIFCCVGGKCVFSGRSKVRYFLWWEESGIFWSVGGKCLFVVGGK